MKNVKNHIAQNLTTLRQLHKYSQEELAEKIDVTRQAVAKWETGESTPDISNCMALAEFYGVTLDNLVNFDQGDANIMIPPKGKHIFGTVKVGERGQVVLPKKAREIFDIKPGDLLVVLGDEAPERMGIALVHEKVFMKTVEFLKDAMGAMCDGDKEDK